MAARRYQTAGGGAATDRHAMLSAYGYSYPTNNNQPPLPQQRTSSPFENPYTSSSATAGPSRLTSSAASSSATSVTATQSSDPYSEYDTKKHDDRPAPPSSWWPNSKNKESDLQASMLEEQNDERLQGLSDRVAILKSITIGIGNEVVEGTKDLNSLGDAMSNARDFLGGTVKRMNHMARRQGGWFCNMMMFLLFVCWLFVFLWWWRR